ncbi:hypothetical protein HRW14_36560 [Streptomyces lunaelactis]|uniref:hypothetical protein n=1 Tax=Streptomyces lunaelactis TaxID=1535768 RepID=UPI001584E1C0|nr:hypothetical protein [Streptomyces lunaelactis]NUK55652.1 hypothetical protein [Streptomyces lunaelactis]NUK69328.1 hypothetical protein [Streptomyces lunaelactis]
MQRNAIVNLGRAALCAFRHSSRNHATPVLLVEVHRLWRHGRQEPWKPSADTRCTHDRWGAWAVGYLVVTSGKNDYASTADAPAIAKLRNLDLPDLPSDPQQAAAALAAFAATLPSHLALRTVNSRDLIADWETYADRVRADTEADERHRVRLDAQDATRATGSTALGHSATSPGPTPDTGSCTTETPSTYRPLPYMFVASCPDIDITVCTTSLQIRNASVGPSGIAARGLYAELVTALDGGSTHQQFCRYSRLAGEDRWFSEDAGRIWLFEPGSTPVDTQFHFTSGRTRALIVPIARKLDFMAWQLGLTETMGGAPQGPGHGGVGPRRTLVGG